MSGAGRIKGDGSDEDRLYEVKDAVKQYALKQEELKTLWKQATQQGKEPVFLIEFPEFTVECQITKKSV